MKAAFGILALYLSIPLAIVAAQGVVAHQASLTSSVQRASVTGAPGAAILATR
jgi:hypothetical protein